jgi:RNA polymerase sigma factor (sigma-70 family)
MISDKELVDNILAGNEEAYSFLVNKYKNLVFSICLRIIENKEEAEDLSQEVFVKAYFSLKNHKKNESKFSNWLYRIAYTTSISKRREFRFQKQKKVDIKNLKDEVVDVNIALINTEKQERKLIIRQAMDKLNHDERFLIHMYYFLDCSIEEISYITSQSKDYIKLRLYRTRIKLKGLLTPVYNFKTI